MTDPHRAADDPTTTPTATPTATTPRTGVCYFPEHWPRERWAEDAAQMADAGLTYVRMAEFSWARLEPERGAFDFGWLDGAIDALAAEGLSVVLCTPTATPPKWLVDERPEILQEEPDGTVRGFGGRRHYCFNSPAYREETERIVTRLAERYADQEAVVGWQTDNEYGCHRTVRCYCDDCARAFREWLRERYGDADGLNEAWGTTFWSQRHASLSEVDPPRHAPAEHHPSRLLDYARFASDSVVAYDRLQADCLRAANPDWFVTHNFMGDFPTLDAHAVSEDLDVVAWDSYPTGFVQDRRPGEATEAELRAGDPDQVGLNHDLYRGAKRAPFWVMEQQPGDVNWPPYAPQPADGAVRLWTHHAVAHGASVVSYFRWRRCLEGQEQYHAGLRKRDGSPDRAYGEASRAAEELSALDLAPVDAPVALLHDYDALWALDAQPHAPTFDYWAYLRSYYRALRARGVQVDVIHPGTSLDGYAAVVAPALHLVDGSDADRLGTYVRDGGHLLLGARSGVKDPANKLHAAPAPGPLADLVGATVERHESLPERLDTVVTYRGERYDYRTWAEWLEATEASVTAEHATGIAAGNPAAVERRAGDGSVAYCGVWPGADLADALVADLLDRAGVDCAARAPDGVRLAARDGHTWVTNFSDRPVRATAPDDAEWAIGGETVPAYGVSVVRTAPSTLSVTRE
ncbi:beta-galactosidase [Halomarina pelagica]|uniref:beta-galactosidase n=1 Tax=Halomarina pelagica TaxID=2961599 RepID=UPI0026E53452|nr:beta-galactosidase [Halomarina sp. BND7]